MRPLNEAFAHALKSLRNEAGLTQYDFPPLVSREYLSMLERGKRSPSLEMLDVLAKKLGVHPLSLVAQCYLAKSSNPNLDELLATVKKEVKLKLLEDPKAAKED